MLNTLLLISTLAITIPQTDTEVCSEWSKMAELIMTRYQEGYTQEYLVGQVMNSTANDIWKQSMAQLIQAAFSVPVVQHIHEKLELIDKFGDAIFMECLNNIAKEALPNEHNN